MEIIRKWEELHRKQSEVCKHARGGGGHASEVIKMDGWKRGWIDEWISVAVVVVVIFLLLLLLD